jgi:NADH-quinone oxidoreductase subunit H
LVAGFNVDYSSILFALFFLGEYSNMILQSVLIVILFLGGWQINIAPIIFFDPLITNNVLYYKNDHIFELLTFIFFSLKIAFICFLFVFVRALYPRFRYE